MTFGQGTHLMELDVRRSFRNSLWSTLSVCQGPPLAGQSPLQEVMWKPLPGRSSPIHDNDDHDDSDDSQDEQDAGGGRGSDADQAGRLRSRHLSTCLESHHRMSSSMNTMNTMPMMITRMGWWGKILMRIPTETWCEAEFQQRPLRLPNHLEEGEKARKSLEKLAQVCKSWQRLAKLQKSCKRGGKFRISQH